MYCKFCRISPPQCKTNTVKTTLQLLKWWEELSKLSTTICYAKVSKHDAPTLSALLFCVDVRQSELLVSSVSR